MLAHLQGTLSQEEQMLYELVWLIIAFALLFVNRTSENFFGLRFLKKDLPEVLEGLNYVGNKDYQESAHH